MPNLLTSDEAWLEFVFDALEGKGFWKYSSAQTGGETVGAARAALARGGLTDTYGFTIYGAGGFHRYHVYAGGRIVADLYYGGDKKIAEIYGFETRGG